MYVYTEKATQRLKIIVTGSEKTGLVYKKYTCSYYGIYHLFCVCYAKAVSFIEFLFDFYIIYVWWYFTYNTDHRYVRGYYVLNSQLIQLLHAADT